ncbi:DUF1641 domain-containing protein [Nocardioidaceae bacterium]|nr:DUF1641 domain-containing protein [Nocardioidaceae bacterium]
MAKPLTYAPPTPQDTGPQDDVDDLVLALHESGLLRVMAGGARAYPQLLTSLLKAIDADAIRSGIALAGALGDPDPEAAEQLAQGIRKARKDAAAAAADSRPPGFLRLAKRAHDKDVRRGLAAALAALAAVGSSLPK